MILRFLHSTKKRANNSLRSLVLGSTFIAACALSVLIVAGCSTEPIDTRGMTRQQLLVRGDNLVIEGRRLKTEGETNGDDTKARHGDEMIQEGKRLKDKALAMPAPNP